MTFIEGLSYNWFLLYYFSLSLLFLILGLAWIIKPGAFGDYLVISSRQEKRPVALVIMLRYFALFTLLSLFFSFFPFSWIELVFTFWCFGIVYLGGSYLLRWEVIRDIILEKKSQLNRVIRKLGATMLAVSVLIFMLCLIHIDQGM
ncbi:MAG: hypothetical protein ABR545_11600 [Cyclonatronaceae bacterium]